LSVAEVPAAVAPSPVVAGAWIGPPPSLAQRLTVFWIGLVGVLFPGVGPLLLGGLEGAGRLTANQLGLAGMGELVAMGIGAAALGPLFGERRLRLAALTGALALAALDLATTRVSGDLLILVRAVAGLPAGVMIWLITGMIVRAPRPERWAGLYLTIQTLLQLGVVSAIGAFVVGPFGPDGGFAVLAAQVARCGAATALAGRLSWFWSLAVAVALAIGALFVMASLPSAAVFQGAAGVFGLGGLFA
jgi:hypothetical protein